MTPYLIIRTLLFFSPDLASSIFEAAEEFLALSLFSGIDFSLDINESERGEGVFLGLLLTRSDESCFSFIIFDEVTLALLGLV